ncbi:acyltransferase family protein [Burkholderia gladioli]|uniref:acyltransferase family protein n=1 Tax=Burkholderia gladioli TaxID=28095 RepID=UPI00163E5C5A|nr:acyltransferase family protein [Burkholderia gladioli]
MKAGHGRLAFAHQLRGIAVLQVVISHYLQLFWERPEVVDRHIGLRLEAGAPPALVAWLADAGIATGSIGVAIFFLISGLVIPISITRLRRRFLLARLLRIYPTYLAALAVNLVVYCASHAGAAMPWPGPLVLASNLLLLNPYLRIASLDMVNWTLAIEMTFYCLAALGWRWVERYGRRAIVATGAAVLAAALLLRIGMPDGGRGMAMAVVGEFVNEAMFVSFILLGTLCYLHLEGRLTTRALLLGLAFGYLGFCAIWLVLVRSHEIWRVPMNYLLALLIFTGSYFFRHRFRGGAWLARLADISYPLYLVHALLGYCVIRLLMAQGQPYSLAVLVATCAALGLAAVLHQRVERPSLHYVARCCQIVRPAQEKMRRS